MAVKDAYFGFGISPTRVKPVPWDRNDVVGALPGYVMETGGPCVAKLSVACGPETGNSADTVLEIEDLGSFQMFAHVTDNGHSVGHEKVQIRFKGEWERAMLKAFCQLIIDFIEEDAEDEKRIRSL